MKIFLFQNNFYVHFINHINNTIIFNLQFWSMKTCFFERYFELYFEIVQEIF